MKDSFYSYNELLEIAKQYADECEKLRNEVELLTDNLKELKEGITGVYNNMIALEIINKYEKEEIEVI